MPRTLLSIHGRKNAQHRAQHPTLLDSWLTSRGFSKISFARQIGCDPKTVKFWCWGQVIPDLVYAFIIDKVTGGGVPVSSWMGTELAKLVWRERILQQVEE